ncbi:MAG: M12 family metallopeptidase [Acidobacteria bacterium]|nr:M12 family metallopeptidase [Acidobacteriota bacterium]
MLRSRNSPPREFGPNVDPNRAALILVNENKWVNGTELHYYFFTGGPWGGSKAQQDVVREAFANWKELGIGLEFHEVTDRDEAEIRIGFQQGAGAWSYVGTYVLNIGQDQRTMNFGWDLTRPGEIDTAIHEIGHTLGLPHEHQNPNAGIVWDEEAVYATLAGSPNFWPREKTFHNIIRKIDPDTVQGSNWDPDSVMHYPFDAGLIQEPARFRTGLRPAPGLSSRDVEWIKTFYPELSPQTTELQPFQSAALNLLPGEQADFLVNPDATRSYTFRTFGQTDTVMVLFEKRNGEWRYVKGDDDSGEALNAQFDTRLVAGREYMLRIRLYWSNASGSTAVMMW